MGGNAKVEIVEVGFLGMDVVGGSMVSLLLLLVTLFSAVLASPLPCPCA